MTSGSGSEMFRERGPRLTRSSSVLDLTPEERDARKRLYGFGKGAYRRSKPSKPYSQILDEALERALAHKHT